MNTAPPEPVAMDRELLSICLSPHVPVPSTFTSGGCCRCVRGKISCCTLTVPACCVDFLTILNYLWTTEVQVLAADMEDGRATISYGGGNQGVEYFGIRRESVDSVIVISTLGPEFGTKFHRGADGALRMTYVRDRSKAEFILSGEGSVDLPTAEQLAGCGCCSRGCIHALQCCVNPCAQCLRQCNFYNKSQGK
mmetsp:Transcript_26188/g.43336  ORF Transcript_26188/g.43336 Transcript_26188/m.43336 type:complete len:194 (+) Transcript_26188:92-673(+)